MHSLGIDLATRRYADIGLALLTRQNGCIQVQLVRPTTTGQRNVPTVTALAGLIAELNKRYPLQVIAIDGPQAWKGADTGLAHARTCEKTLNTQAKTGLPGVAKPASALRFVQFAIDLFDTLAALGWPRLTEPVANPPIPVAVEVWPTAAWRALGLRALPAKRATAAQDVAHWLAQLQARFPLRLTETPTHDELQAIMAGLVGMALGDGDLPAPQFYGLAPAFCDSAWREGYLVNFSRE
jgi:uncharacterized protein YlxP (DUF503 family)